MSGKHDVDDEQIHFTKSRLRPPPCKRQRTRSATNSVAVSVKEEHVKDQGEIVEKKGDEEKMIEKCETKQSERILRRVAKQQSAQSVTTCTVNVVKQDDVKDVKDQQGDNTGDSKVPPKCRRQWEQWSDNDIECFFQGLAEHAKDFGSIQLFMKRKRKSKQYDTKTKEQIRFYYHRTWAKISKSLNLLQEVDQKKAYRREIHYMLCLGELRKKGAQGLGHKVLMQLHELVTKGFTYVRHKGRNIRVRPPNRFLKRLYCDENTFQDHLLPKHVNIEFLPNTNCAFNYVQMHAFNPRIRFVNVNLSSKFSEVFEMFNRRFTDFSSETENLTFYPVFSSDIDSTHFAEVLSNAEDVLESSERKQDSPIILEDTRLPSAEKEPLNSSIEDIDESFPKLFGQNDESSIVTKQPIKPFEGYWMHSTADEIHLRTLYLALGKPIAMKFRYEWKKVKDKPTALNEALTFLRCHCMNESYAKELANISSKIETIASKRKEVEPVVVPLRPRPGRQKRFNIINSQMCIPKNRVLNSNNMSQQLNNAVAVNIIPPPPGLDQYSNSLNDSLKPLNTPDSVSPNPQPTIVCSTNGNTGEEEGVTYTDVLDEGFRMHFKSLATLLSSSALNQNGVNHHDIRELLKNTPTKNSSKLALEAPSPNLDWLNAESVDITLSSFLNVNEMQALQDKLKLDQAASHHNGDTEVEESPSASEGNAEVPTNLEQVLDGLTTFKQEGLSNGLKKESPRDRHDPKLPIFHTGDTSQEPFSMSFDLSNQEPVKEQFTLT